ncbi:MAG TPA: STAS domain-containing protein, partial [Candidatus Ozemobacteraceae bacterium]|nr:STAS domain-containing protein [Candidatus Ozemobacteraceae bacterium]
MERMTFTAECENGVFVLSVSGELDIYTLPKVKQAAEMIIERGVRSIVLNLSGLVHLDSTAIGFLVQLDRR